MNLLELLNNEQIEKISINLSDVELRFDKAQRIFSFAKKNMVGDNASDADIIYTNLYDAIRIGCETILLLYGYRVRKSSEGHHYIAINAASELMVGRLESEFQRIQKMRQKRNRFDYGNLNSISEIELRQAMVDADTLLKEISKLIKG